MQNINFWLHIKYLNSVSSSTTIHTTTKAWITYIESVNIYLIRVIFFYLELVFAVVQYLELLGLVVQRNLLAPRHLDVLHRGLDLVHHSLQQHCMCFNLYTFKIDLEMHSILAP